MQTEMLLNQYIRLHITTNPRLCRMSELKIGSFWDKFTLEIPLLDIPFNRELFGHKNAWKNTLILRCMVEVFNTASICTCKSYHVCVRQIIIIWLFLRSNRYLVVNQEHIEVLALKATFYGIPYTYTDRLNRIELESMCFQSI